MRIVHVVYADAVAYSKLEFAQKRRYDDALGSLAPQAYADCGVLAKVDNGDGFAFAMDGEPDRIVEATLRLRETLAAQTGVVTRFAVHTGLAYIRSDLNGQNSLTGPAIEIAQRMMVASDGSAVVVSTSMREILRSFPAFAGRLLFPKWSRTKHGEVLAVTPVHAFPLPRVCLLGDPTEATYQALVDLSSRMPEVDWALNDENFGPESSVAQLESEESSQWFSVGGTASAKEAGRRGFRVDQLPLEAEHAAAILIAAIGPTFGQQICVEGPVPLRGCPYVERSADRQLREALHHGESVIQLRAPAGFGKTSMLLRVPAQIRALGAVGWILDLEACDEHTLSSIESFYRWIIDSLSHQRGVSKPEWEDWIGPNSNLENAVLRLAEEDRIILIFDGVERLFDRSYRHDFFGLLRSWHNRRAMALEQAWSRLSILLAYSGDAQSMLLDVNQSPFNVGVRIELGPFQREELEHLTRATGADSGQIFAVTEGHPTLSAYLAWEGWKVESGDAFTVVRRRPFMRRLAAQLSDSPSLFRPEDPHALWKALSLGLVTLTDEGKPRSANPLMAKLIEEKRR